MTNSDRKLLTELCAAMGVMEGETVRETLEKLKTKAEVKNRAFEHAQAFIKGIGNNCKNYLED